MSPLRRLGNKARLLPQLLSFFPDTITTFIDMFMGSGTVTFAMVNRCKYIIANDNDENIFNLFMVIKERKKELLDALAMMPIHESLFNHWKVTQEDDPIWKAVRFLMLSNFGYLGMSETLAFDSLCNSKNELLSAVSEVFAKLMNVQFMCCDFRKVLPKIHWRLKDFGRTANYKERAFIYADPPYLNTNHNYAHGFTEADTADLFDILVHAGIRFALSEFRHPLVMALAEEHGLHVTSLGERHNLKNRREELLITNYDPQRKQQELFA